MSFDENAIKMYEKYMMYTNYMMYTYHMMYINYMMYMNYMMYRYMNYIKDEIPSLAWHK